MKIIHCADIHIDSKMEALSSEKSKLRRNEILSTFEKVCSFAGENGVRAVIIAGDLFDTDRVTNKTRDRIFRAIKSQEKVDFLYLKGNHDDKVFFDCEIPNNLKIFSNSWNTFSYDNVEISGIVLDKTNSNTFYDTLNLNENKVNIVTLHGQVAGYKSQNQAEIISIPRLKDKNIDYLALGHVHEYCKEKLDNRGVYSYCGCLEGRGFDETGEKGFVEINIENNKVSSSFKPFALRRLYEIEFDVSNFNSFYDCAKEIVKSLEESCVFGSLIKVILKGNITTEFIVDKERLIELLSRNFFYSKVYDKTQVVIKKEDYENDKSVRGEFVRAVLSSDLDDEIKSKVILLGLNALKGEDL